MKRDKEEQRKLHQNKKKVNVVPAAPLPPPPMYITCSADQLNYTYVV